MNHVSTQDGTMKQRQDHIPAWQKNVWTGCALSLMLLIVGLVFLVGQMLWQLVNLLRPTPPDNSFVFAGMTLLYSSLLRLLAILIGGAISFAGLAVSFYAHQQATSLGADAAREHLGNAKAALATNSPGIVAVVIGALVIVVALMLRAPHTYMPLTNAGAAWPQLPPPASEVLSEPAGSATSSAAPSTAPAPSK